jgi:hypothetical protein
MEYTEEVVQDTQDVAQEVVEQVAQPLQQPQNNYQANNFKRLREEKERTERENAELLRAMRELQAKQIVPNDDHLTQEEKIYKSLQQEIASLKSEVKEYHTQTSMMSTKARLQAQHPDFYSVVNEENIARLRDEYPEIAHTLDSSKDMYTGGVAAYTMIKKLGIGGQDMYKEEKELAQKNAAKPKNSASITPQQGQSPLSQANAFQHGLTDALKKQLNDEMNRAAAKR